MYWKYWAATTAFAGILSAAATAPNVRVIEEIVAKVNGDIITRGELERTREAIQAELAKEGLTGDKLAAEVKQKESDALRDQIDQNLLVQHAKDLNIKVDPEVTRRIAEVQAQSKLSDPDKFHEWLKEQSGGLTFEDFKQQMTNQLLTQRVIGQEVGSKISVPDAEVQKYYDEHKTEFVRQEMVFLREILISTGDKTPAAIAAAEKKAKDIQARARKGEKFTELAKNYSDAETAKNEGELGAFKKGDLKKEIEDIVFKQKKGYVTDLIRTDNGFEIIKVEDRYEPGQAALEDVKNDIMEKLYVPRMQPALRTYLTKLRSDAFIEIRGGFVDSGAAPNKDTTWKDPALLKPQTTTKEEVQAHKKNRFMKIIPRPGGKVDASVPSGPPAPPPATTAPPTAAPAK